MAMPMPVAKFKNQHISSLRELNAEYKVRELNKLNDNGRYSVGYFASREDAREYLKAIRCGAIRGCSIPHDPETGVESEAIWPELYTGEGAEMLNRMTHNIHVHIVKNPVLTLATT